MREYKTPWDKKEEKPVYTSNQFLRAHQFLEHLKKNSEHLTRQQFLTLRGQALSGDIEGANKGLEKIVREGL